MVLLLLGAMWWLYDAMTDPQRIRHLCVQYLAGFVDGEVSIENARFDLFDGVHLDGVRVTERRSKNKTTSANRPFFYCRNLLLKHDPLTMLSGRLVVEEVVAVNPVCNLVRVDETGEYNISRILRRPARRHGPARKPRLPVVRLRNASLILTRENDGKRRDVDRINISVLATPLSQTTRSYSVAWKRRGATPAAGRSLFNPGSLSFEDLEGGLPWLSLETGMLAVATQVPGAESWFTLLGLSGQIKAKNYDISLRADPSEPGRMTLQLRNASLSVPVDAVERQLPREQRYLCFDGVEGTVELSPGQAEVRFTGTFHGAPCRVSAVLVGDIGPQTQFADIGVSADITCEGFELPSADDEADPGAARFTRRWRALRSFYNDFNPHGQVNLEVSLAKAVGAGEPLHLERGVMTVLHADGTYRKFPYRVRNITGTVEFTPEGIHLRELSGDHAGAAIVVNGWLAEARWYSASQLHIAGQGVPLDSDLHYALNNRYRKLWDTFELAGSADITVNMTRAAGTEKDPKPYATRINAELIDARARFAGFPYPVENLSGEVSIAGERLGVTRLSGCNGSTRVVVGGYAHLAEDGLADLDLQLEAREVAFDARLLAALSGDARAQIVDFSPRGTFNLSGSMGFDPSTRQATYNLDAALHGITVTYSKMPVPVEHVTGTIRLRPGHITLESITGRYGQGTVAAEGSFSSWADDSEAQLTVTCTDLVADEVLLEALPERLGDVWRDLRITGPVRAVTDYRKRTGHNAASTTLRTTIDVAGTAINAESFPYPLHITEGTVTVEPGRFSIDDLHATHEGTTLSLDGGGSFDDRSVDAVFALSARNLNLDEGLRLALPWRWRRSWNKISPRGAVDLELQRLHYHRDRGAPAAEWAFSGRLTPRGVALDVGLEIADIVGMVDGEGGLGGAGGEFTASATLSLDALTVEGRRVENLRGQLQRLPASGALTLRDLSGRLYGGMVSAEVEVLLGRSAPEYNVSATMHDVGLRAFLRAANPATDQPQPPAGKMDVHFFVSGLSGDHDSRRGGGRVEIHDADLYRLPLIMAILNVINFTISEESAFQGMSADFFVTGREVRVSDLILRGSALALIGSGTVAPATRALDLKLVAVTPHRWAKIPVLTELIEGAARELVEIDVHGSWSDPVIQAKPLRGVEAVFETLFEKKKPKKPKHISPKDDTVQP
ncbi:MAG: hypothetical protein KAV82_14275 [Phycisphaerae bacterium]|nr:hypothetical protein [Phycisphaerae bacterium]